MAILHFPPRIMVSSIDTTEAFRTVYLASIWALKNHMQRRRSLAEGGGWPEEAAR
jgi:hypothetical protein